MKSTREKKSAGNSQSTSLHFALFLNTGGHSECKGGTYTYTIVGVNSISHNCFSSNIYLYISGAVPYGESVKVVKVSSESFSVEWREGGGRVMAG